MRLLLHGLVQCQLIVGQDSQHSINILEDHEGRVLRVPIAQMTPQGKNVFVKGLVGRFL